MSGDAVRLRSGGLAELERAFADLHLRREALVHEPENEELHGRCTAKLGHAARLSGELDVDGQIRRAARRHVMEAARWLAAMPVGRRRQLGDLTEAPSSRAEALRIPRATTAQED